MVLTSPLGSGLLHIKAQTASCDQNILYTPTQISCILSQPTALGCPQQVRNTGQLQLEESSMRLVVVALNVVARYPGKVFQPYVGVGGGAFYFSSSGQVSGCQVVPGLNLITGLKIHLLRHRLRNRLSLLSWGLTPLRTSVWRAGLLLVH